MNCPYVLMQSESIERPQKKQEIGNEPRNASDYMPRLRTKLTREFFLKLPEGTYLQSNLCGLYADEVGPPAKRSEQWSTIPQDVRYRLCTVYKSKEEHDRLSKLWQAPFPTDLLPTQTAKLTRKLFFSFSTDAFLTSSYGGIYEESMAPFPERETQWHEVPKRARYRDCSIYENKAHYEATMQRLEAFLRTPRSASEAPRD